MGDPAGIGPEIIGKALGRPEVHALCRPLVIGDAGIIRNATKFVRASLEVRSIAKVEQGRFTPDGIDVFDLKNVNPEQFQLGKVSAMSGNAAFEAVRTMISLAM